MGSRGGLVQPASATVTAGSLSACLGGDNTELCVVVMSGSGHQQNLQVPHDITVKKLKQLCLPKYIQEKRLLDVAAGAAADVAGSGAGAIGGVSCISEDESYFKLIHPTSGRCLNDQHTLVDCHIKHSDALLLLPKRSMTTTAGASSKQASNDPSRPSDVAISELTANIEPKNTDRKAEKPHPLSNYLSEMRKIILSLIQVSHKVLCYNKEAVEMFREATAILKSNRTSSGPGGLPAQVDRNLVTQLSEMGFSQEKARAALILNDMSVPLAMEWLLANGDEDEASLVAMTKQVPDSQPSDMEGCDASGDSAALSHDASEGLKVLQEFHRLSFKPDDKSLSNLIDMGFDAKQAIDALRVNGNNQNFACDWLLGSRQPSIEEWRKGLDGNSSMYQAIVNNPLVQLSLNNPKILLALEDILIILTL
jgi:Kip1 ubiquitination-promoting complex protein 2